MFNKKKKKPQISLPSNFEHRVHTGFDKREGRYVGLPLQWASIVGNNQILKSTNRPLPLVDPSEITHTEILDLKTIVRPHFNNNKLTDDSMRLTSGGSISGGSTTGPILPTNGIVLPKTSHVARSNSLRSSSPPRMRRDLRGNANVPPSVPEEPTQMGPPSASQLVQYPSIRRDPTSAAIPPPAIYATKPAHGMHPQQQAQPVDWNRQQQSHSAAINVANSPIDTNQNMYTQNNGTNNDQRGINGNGMTGSISNPISVHTELPAPYFFR